MFLLDWIKKNKLSTFLILVVAYLVYKSFFGVSLLNRSLEKTYSGNDAVGVAVPSMGTSYSTQSKAALPNTYPQPDYAPQPDVANRLVIQESNVSLLVKDVVDSRNKILSFASSNGGYMVSSSTSNPQETTTATVVIRIPSDKLQLALDYFHSLSVKVVSENLAGRDVTDQYVDIDTRIKTLETTKARYETILSQATKIEDITSLTTQILNVQSQIDSYKGQQQSLEKNAQLAKLTVYLSTDEIALPYTPNETFRPAIIFKLAVRSLVGSLRDIASYAIWIGVYAVIWLPAIFVYYFIRKWSKRRKLLKQKVN